MRGDQIPLWQQSWALGDIYYSVCEMSNPNLLQKTDLTPFRETDNFQTSIRCSDDLQTLLEIPNDAHMSSKTF